MMLLLPAFSILPVAASAWLPTMQRRVRREGMKTRLDMAQVGIFFGTSTGNTESVADTIYEALGPEVAAEPVDVDSFEVGQVATAFAQHDSLIVGTPTWNTGSDIERSGTGWDEIYYTQMQELKDTLKGKKVAVFGLGDQVSYSANYADACGELYDVFESLGCQMMGHWKIDDSYEHEDSKSIRGDKFCGLLLDMINQEELTDDRVSRWIAQLKEEGFLDSTGTTSMATATANSESNSAEKTSASTETKKVSDEASMPDLEQGSVLMEQSIGVHSSGGFTPHYNTVRKETMWTSPDGRSSFVTVDTEQEVSTSFSP